MDSFDTKDYAVVGSERVGSLVGEHLLRAAHKILTGDLGNLKTDPSPQEIMKLADEYKAEWEKRNPDGDG